MQSRWWWSVVLVGLPLLPAGCAGPARISDESRTLYVTQHPETPPEFASSILAGNIMVGMDQTMVTAAWGAPSRTEKVPAHEQWDEKWTYGNYLVNNAVTHLYFQQGLLVLYEFVNTQTQSKMTVADPNQKLPLRSQPPGGSAKSGGGP
jgi:hypothetical protein